MVSARTGEGIDGLRALIDQALPRPPLDVKVVVPYDRGDLVSRMHTEGEVLSEEHGPDGTVITARIHPDLASALDKAGATR